MGKCSAPNCLSASYKKDPGVSFHRFPKNEKIKKIWLTNMEIKNEPKSSSLICSKHFIQDLIDKDGFRTILISGAVPTILDPNNDIQKQLTNLQNTPDPLVFTPTCPQPTQSYDIREQPSTSKGIKRSFQGHQVLRELQNIQHIVNPLSFARTSTSDLPDPNNDIQKQLTNLQNTPDPLVFTPTCPQPTQSYDIREQPSTSKGIKRSFQGHQVLRELQNIQHIVNPLSFARTSTSDLPVSRKQKVQILQDIIINPSRASIIKSISASKDIPHIVRKKERKRVMSPIKELTFKLNKSQEKIQKLKRRLSIQKKNNKHLKQKNTRLKVKVTKFSEIIEQLRNKEKMNGDDLFVLSAINVENKDLFTRFVKKANGSSIKKSYSPELRAFALQLNFYSPRAYKFVRNSFNTILPHPLTLARWYKKVDAEPGFTAETFDTLEALAKNSKHKILVNISIDEMAIRKELVWDSTENKYKGYVDTGSNVTVDSLPLATQALVILINAINFNWKLPIGYFFITSLSGEQRANIVKMAIEMLDKIKIYVCGVTFDGAASNIRMALNLGCNFNLTQLKPYFNFGNRKINVFYDPCHMIKLIRNAFGEYGTLIDKEGNIINFKYLQMLLDLQTKNGLHLGNKLKQAHIMFSKQKMKVSLATQLFSKSVADALSLCDEKFEEFDGCKATIKFINIINDLFDILNSRSTLAPGHKKALCEANFKITKDVAVQYIDYIMHLKLPNGNLVIYSARKTGFVGFIVCLNSALNLYQELVTKENLRYLPTYKISQDFLEMFFGKMRSRGGFNDNPNVVQFRTAYKKNIINLKIKMQKDGLNMPNPILIVSSTDKAVRTVNVTTPSFEKNIMEYCDLDEKDLNCFFDNILSSPLDEYTTYVTVYIAGFLARKITKVVLCKICQMLMLGEKDNFLCSLINKKDRGGLIYPSKGLIILVQSCEKFFKIFNGKNVNYNNMITYIADSFYNYKDLKYSDEHDNDHLYLLIKIIVKYYIDLRAKYDAKQNNISERNYLKRIILFKNK